MRQEKMCMRLIVMGVSGSGKSAVARLLAERLGGRFVEGDDDHPPENIAKMRSGEPLTDDDRHGWLIVLRDRIANAVRQKTSLVLTCSALKRRYRDMLREGDRDLLFVHLHGERELIESRMKARSGHFMAAGMLDSQLRDLEPLGEDEKGIRLDIRHSPEELVDQAVERIRMEQAGASPLHETRKTDQSGS